MLNVWEIPKFLSWNTKSTFFPHSLNSCGNLASFFHVLQTQASKHPSNTPHTVHYIHVFVQSVAEVHPSKKGHWNQRIHDVQTGTRSSWQIHVPATEHVKSCMFMVFLFTATIDWNDQTWGEVSLLRRPLFSWIIYFLKSQPHVAVTHVGISQRNGCCVIGIGIENWYSIGTSSWLVGSEISIRSWTNGAAMGIYVTLTTQKLHLFYPLLDYK